MNEMTTKKDIGLIELFMGFAALALKGFGGVAPYVYQDLVVEKKWLDVNEYAELISICQILPGANITNLSAIFGYRKKGYYGAIAATSGLVIPPSIVLFISYFLLSDYVQTAIVQGALTGILSVAIALILITILNVLKSQPLKKLNFSIICIISILVLIIKLPLIFILLTMIPINFYLFRKLTK